MTRSITETLVVRVGALGVAEDAMATRSVVLDLDAMSNEDIGRALAGAFRECTKDAVVQFAPLLSAAWQQQTQRMSDGDV